MPRAATEAQIKRAYRKLALKLHPDKNKARGADEAFKGAGFFFLFFLLFLLCGCMCARYGWLCWVLRTDMWHPSATHSDAIYASFWVAVHSTVNILPFF